MSTTTTATTATEPRGLGDFAGTTIRGSDAVLSRLPEVQGKRVALVGDPLRVAQFVGRLSAAARILKVFQHDPVWVLPRVVGPAAPLAATARSLLPPSITARLDTTVAERNLQLQVRDGWTRRQLTPQQPPEPGNVIRSNRYYRALQRGDVQLVTWPIAGVVAAGVRTADGLEHHVDVIVIV